MTPATSVRPPGPARSIFSTLTYRPARDPLKFFTSLAKEYGDVVRVRMGPEQAYLINEPSLIKDVLVTNQRHYHKGRALERSKRLLGQGLLTSEDDLHVRTIPTATSSSRRSSSATARA